MSARMDIAWAWHQLSRLWRAGVTLCALASALAPSAHAQQAPPSRPSPMEVREAWLALRQAMLATRNADNRGTIPVEEAERRFAQHAETARLLLQSYDEPASGKVLPPGGTITGEALVGGYFPTLARAYCAWMAAQRSKDPAKQYGYYTAVYEALWHGGGDDESASGGKAKARRSSQLHAVYSSPFVRRMAIAAALARRRLSLELARQAGDAEAAGASVAAEIEDLLRLRPLPPSAFVKVPAQPDVEDIVGKSGYLELLDKSVATVLNAELAAAKPRFRLVEERPDWQSEGAVKVIRGSVDVLGPVVVKAVDARTNQPIPNASQKNVTSEFDLRITLEEKPEPTPVQIVLEDALSGSTVTWERQIALWNIPQPSITVAERRRVVAGVAVGDLSFSVQRLLAGDSVRVELGPENQRRKVMEEGVADKGDRTFTVPRFVVAPNVETSVTVTVRRKDRDVASEQLVVVSQTVPVVSGRILRVNELVHVVEVVVQDYGTTLPRITVNGRQYPDDVKPVETVPGSGENPSRYVFLVPLTAGGGTVSVQAGTARSSEVVAIAWPSDPPKLAADDPRLARLPDYQRELVRGDLDAGERAYLGILTDAAHAQEARDILEDLYDYWLRRAPQGATREAETYLSRLRILAKAVGRGGDLDARIAQIQAEEERQRRAEEERKAREAAQRAKEQKEREEAERRAREAQQAREALEARQRLEKTPVEVSVVSSAYSAEDSLLIATLKVSGLVLDRRVVGIKLDDTDVEDAASFVTTDAATSSATVTVVGVPLPSASAMRVAVVVAFPGSGNVPSSVAVPLQQGTVPALTGKLGEYAALMRTGQHAGGAGVPGWLVTMVGRRLQGLVDSATAAISAVTREPRPANAVNVALATIKRARDYASAVNDLPKVTQGVDVAALETRLRSALEPKLSVENVALVKKPGGGYALGPASVVRVQSWADAVTLRFGDTEVKGARSGGEWRFSLGGVTAQQGKVKVVASASAGDAMLQTQADVSVELPPAAISFKFTKPDFVYCDDGAGNKSLVFSANEAGRNSDTRIEFDPQGIKLIAWDVVDKSGNVVPGTERSPKPPPLDGVLQIEDGKLGVGLYTVRVRLWDSEDASQTPARAEVRVRIAPAAVAFLVGINYYATGQFPLRHAADDAMALRAKLIERGYAPENIVYVIGRNDSGTPEMRTNGLQNVKSATPNDLSETRRPGQRFGLASGKVVASAFDTFLKLVQQRKARHVLVFFAGHGTNVTASLTGRTALNVDHLIMADDSPEEPSKVYVWDWPTRVKANVNWGSKDNPVTVMCIYDACRNGTKAPFDATPPDLSSDDGAVLCSALFSCRKGQQANENLDDDPRFAIAYRNEVFKNGFFTYALLRALDELPPNSVRMPDVIQRTNAILAELGQLTQEKNRLASGSEKPYFEGQSLRPVNDLRGWEQSLPVIFPAAQSSVHWPPSFFRVAAFGVLPR